MNTPQSPKNGAFWEEDGQIVLRIVCLDEVTDHEISIPEAHCIAAELMIAIQHASKIATGRDTQPTQ